MMVIDNKFSVGEIVYLKTDGDQLRRVITALKVLPNDCILYELSCGATHSFHYDFEINEEEDVSQKVI